MWNGQFEFTSIFRERKRKLYLLLKYTFILLNKVYIQQINHRVNKMPRNTHGIKHISVCYYRKINSSGVV